MNLDREIADAILRLASERGADKTICPSEVARAIAGQDEVKWRALMAPIRGQAVALSRVGSIEITKGGDAVDPDNFAGIFRIRIIKD